MRSITLTLPQVSWNRFSKIKNRPGAPTPGRLSNIPKNDTSSQNILYHLRKRQTSRTFVLAFFLILKIEEGDIMSALKNGALYIRVSTADQTELSPDAQQRLLLDYAKKNGATSLSLRISFRAYQTRGLNQYITPAKFIR